MPEMDGVTFLREALRLSRHGRHHAHRHGRGEHGGRVPQVGGPGLHLEAGDDGGGPRPAGQGAGEAPAGAAEPVLPAEPRGPGPGAGPAEQGIADQRRADAGARARGQGRIHQRALGAGEPLRHEDRGAARLHRRARWSTSASAGAARHRQDRHPGGHPEQARAAHARTSSSTSRSTPPWGRRSWRPS